MFTVVTRLKSPCCCGGRSPNDAATYMKRRFAGHLFQETDKPKRFWHMMNSILMHYQNKASPAQAAGWGHVLAACVCDCVTRLRLNLPPNRNAVLKQSDSPLNISSISTLPLSPESFVWAPGICFTDLYIPWVWHALLACTSHCSPQLWVKLASKYQTIQNLKLRQ